MVASIELFLEKKPADPRNEVAVAVIKESEIVAMPYSMKLFTDHMAFYYTKELYCVILLRKGKGLEVPCKYICFDGSIKEHIFLYKILFAKVTK